jgi:hypothetical protein
LAQIGLLFIIVPYVAYGTNALVHNAEETDVDKLKPISMQEFATILGLH